MGADQLELFTEIHQQIISEELYENYAHGEKQVEESDSLLSITENMILGSIETIDNVMKGSSAVLGERFPNYLEYDFRSLPLCTLRSIGHKMSCRCKDVGHEEGAIKNIALKILAEIPEYSWKARVLLVLAAFALEYAEFSLLARVYYTDDQLGKSLAMFKQVSLLFESTNDQQESKQSQTTDLNILIKHTLDVIKGIYELEKLTFAAKDVPDLQEAMSGVPVIAFLLITTLVTCAAKVTQLLVTDDKKRPSDLTSQFVVQINLMRVKFMKQVQKCQGQKEDADAYRLFYQLISFRTRSEVTEVIRDLQLWDDKNVLPKIDNKPVDVKHLKGKHVLFVFSKLEMSVEKYSVLKPIYEGTRKYDQCTIVWFPVVKKWSTVEQEQYVIKFAELNSKIPCTAVHNSLSKESQTYIKEEWGCNFEDCLINPIAVLITPQGKLMKDLKGKSVKATDAGMLVHLYRLNKLSSLKWVEKPTTEVAQDWITAIVNTVHPKLIPASWNMKDETKYTFFYGGKDNLWIEQFRKRVESFKVHGKLKQLNLNASIQSFLVGKSTKVEETHAIVKGFWSKVEALYYAHVRQEVNQVTEEIHKLFSYQYQSGWAVLCRGSTVVTTGHGSTILKVLEGFDTVHKNYNITNQESFEYYFKTHHKVVTTTDSYCSPIDIQDVFYARETMKCPNCSREVGKSVIYRYECCHGYETPYAPLIAPH